MSWIWQAIIIILVALVAANWQFMQSIGGAFLGRNLTRFGDGREFEVLKHVVETTEEGNPEAVLNAIDYYGWNHHMLMNVGDEKGKVLDDAINEHHAKVVIELGAYCGYSAVRIGRLLKPKGGHLYSIELDPVNAALATKMVEWAGLRDTVTILIGTLSTRVDDLRKRFNINTIDLAFLDHHKTYYLPDLKLLESSNLLRKGTVIVADNVIFPGTPDYLAYIRNSSLYDTKLVMGKVVYDTTGMMKDGIEVSVFKGHSNDHHT